MDDMNFQRSLFSAGHMTAVPFPWSSPVGCQYAFSLPLSYPPFHPSANRQAYWPPFPGSYGFGEQLKIDRGSKCDDPGDDDSNLSGDTDLRKRRRSSTSGDSADTCVGDKQAAAAANAGHEGVESARIEKPQSPCYTAESDEDLPDQDVVCAEVLQLLRRGSWDSTISEDKLQPQITRMLDGAVVSRPNKRCRTSGSARRTYTWRSLHHRNKSEEEESNPEKTNKSANPEMEVRQASSTSSHKEQDKEWAALTTWLRMNLHQLRTSKRQVLFTADFPAIGKPWVFQLNPNLTWDDINEDTKLRLKTLPEETEAAYARKYPKRPSCEWQRKTQKYRPQDSATTVQVPLGEMVNSLRDIYFIQEGKQPPQQ